VLLQARFKYIFRMNSSNHTKILTDLHTHLSNNDFENVLNVLSSIHDLKELEEVTAKFVATYRYNPRIRFMEKADFESCLRLSNIWNKRLGMN